MKFRVTRLGADAEDTDPQNSDGLPSGLFYDSAQPVLARLQEECKLSGSQAIWALQNNFSTSYISDVLHGNREVTERLAEALGFQKRIVWQDLRANEGEQGTRA